MKISILTLFPEMFDAVLNQSILKRARDKGLYDIEIINIRDFSKDKYHHVDDTPCGGGAGMLLQIEPIDLALQSVRSDNSFVLLTSPKAKPFNQLKAREYANKEHIVIVCGHYEGFDARVETLVDDRLSIGDFILTGGELAAMVVVDSVVRLLNDAISKDSLDVESFDNNLLEYPQYTKPPVYKGMKVPDVLLSGHHKNIQRYRLKEALKDTLRYRSDLLKNHEFTKEEIELLKEIRDELKNTK
ncbi:MAG: tRNA (guanosine(37)-N1)-methyltransferase TrmD [Erysipelotrichaceae bacterium]|nr:tRNA (guanosine(37)-N1)-methyltransferase TrmD [Erysipelotrichaceae bacterium]